MGMVPKEDRGAVDKAMINTESNVVFSVSFPLLLYKCG